MCNKENNSLATVRPDLAKYWHPTKNGDLTPEKVDVNSSIMVWWCMPYDDPKTGKHFDFEWKAKVSDIVRGRGCPYLVPPKLVWVGFNDLATTHPEIAKEWHPTKNGNLKPTDVTAGSGKKVWWILSYNDPKTEKHFDFEWEAMVANRTKGIGCPYLTNQMVYIGLNDLATTNPELAAEWHPKKNGDLKPTDVTAGSEKKVWWYLPYDDPKTGKHFDFEWIATVASRTSGAGCPYLVRPCRAIRVGFNDLATTHPEIAKEWHPTKNGDLKPTDVTAGSNKKVWWLKPYNDPVSGKHFDFEWMARIEHRTTNNGKIPCFSKIKNKEDNNEQK